MNLLNNDEFMMYKHWLRQAIFRLNVSENPKCDAEVILKTVTGKSRAFLLAFDTESLNNQEMAQANALLMRRIQGEPMAYLIGMREFWSLNFKISPDVFIPRPDTECLVEQVLLNFSSLSYLKVLDLGTGSGAIALAIASECLNWQVTGIDFLYKIINLAHKNADMLKITNVMFLQGNWFYGLKKNFYDIIVSNPPYIDINDYYSLRGDVRFEPKTALIAKNKGLADLSHICNHSVKYLKLGGYLLLEHGWLQGEKVRQLFIKHGFKNIITVRDYNNNERVTYGQLM